MKKVLVAYASRYGSTAEIGHAIAARLCERGEAVDACSIDEVKDLSLYDAVVVGSAVRMGSWLPAAVRFVAEHKEALRKVPTAFYTVHILALGANEESKKTRVAYLDAVRSIVMPQHEAFFPGKLDPKQLNLLDRVMAKAVQSPEGDLRNWQEIWNWADEIFQKEEVLR
ncbi:MAG: flavodoxin domain-containing protein [Caldilineaceae bacterium]|nr:flavodoxin domain-containing protein [Caldilineaceae bacterium]